MQLQWGSQYHSQVNGEGQSNVHVEDHPRMSSTAAYGDTDLLEEGLATVSDAKYL